MTDTAASQESLEAMLKGEIVRMYQEVADNPDGEFHFFHGPQGGGTVRVPARMARPGACRCRRLVRRSWQPASAGLPAAG